MKIKLGNIFLTPREAECLAAMMFGLTMKETADKLKIGIRTVTGHRENIKNKFCGKKRSEIFMYAWEHNFPPKKFIRRLKDEIFKWD